MKQTAQTSSNRRSFIKTITFAGTASAVAVPIQTGGADTSPSRSGRRIGFVDFNLENYHSNVFLQALRGPLAGRGFVVAGATGMKTAESAAWAEKYHVQFFENDAELNAAVDCYMILAPSNPEVHLDLCRRFLPFRKPVYVDKTFAPNSKIARQIFELADEQGAPIQTTSALRYTNVQDELAKTPARIEHMITWGGGSSFDEYAIHPLELLVSVMGHEATALLRRGTPERTQLLIEFTGGRTGVANVFTRTNTPFAASATTEKATRYIEVDSSTIFIKNQSAILDFFESRKPNVDRRESLTLMRLLDAARDPAARNGFVALG